MAMASNCLGPATPATGYPAFQGLSTSRASCGGAGTPYLVPVGPCPVLDPRKGRVKALPERREVGQRGKQGREGSSLDA